MGWCVYEPMYAHAHFFHMCVCVVGRGERGGGGVDRQLAFNAQSTAEVISGQLKRYQQQQITLSAHTGGACDFL